MEAEKDGEHTGAAGPRRPPRPSGGRARHRQEHRRRRARLQQLRGDRPRGDGPGGRRSLTRPSSRTRHRRALGADHAVARRDGRRREGDGAPRHGAAAPRRRRNHVAAAHRGPHRARVPPSPTVHVLDASRVTAVVGSLLEPERRAALDGENRVEQERLRALHAERERRPLLPIRAARERRTPINWHADDLAVPAFTGDAPRRALALRAARPYVDWTFFFHAWDLKGRYPAILEAPREGRRRA